MINFHRSLVCVYSALFVLLVASFATDCSAQESKAAIISSPEFILSNEAKAAGIDGRLQIALKIDKTGNVSKVDILAGPAWPCNSNPMKEIEDVRRRVKESLITAKFSPAIKDGKPTNSEIVVKFAIGRAYAKTVKERDAEDAAEIGKVVIDKGILNGRTLKLPPPEYSDSARLQRLSGSVPIEVLINEVGNVVLAGAIGGHPLLQAPSRDSACRAKFEPTIMHGKPVEVTGVITYNFVP